jgi:hypothetical protein
MNTRAIASTRIVYSGGGRQNKVLEYVARGDGLLPVLVLVVASTPRPSPTDTRPGYGDEPFRLRRPLAGRPDSARPSARGPISDFGQGLTRLGLSVRTAAHAHPGPQRIQTTSNIKKEGLHKGHTPVCTTGRA